MRPPIAYPAGPYHALLLRHARRTPSRATLFFEDRAVTIGALADGAAALARGLRHLGLRPGERLAMYVPNGVEAILTFLAGSMAGTAVVPINPSYREREVRHLLADSGASAVVAGERQWAVAAAAWPQCPALRYAIVTASISDARCVRFDDLVGGEAGLAGAEAHDNGRLALLPYSSGTTGLPKGVMLTHANLVATIAQFAAALAVNADDVLLNFLPLSHIYGLMVTGIALAAGARLVLLERFDLEHTLALVERHRATILFAVPPVITALGTTELVKRHDLSSLRFINTGAAPQPPEAIARAAEMTGVPVITGYGLTEGAPVCHSPVPSRDRARGARSASLTRAGFVGAPVNDTEIRIVDPETGEGALPPERVGELLVRGPQVMHGYWNRPEDSAEVLRDGWLHTGDLATIATDGSVAIVGRTKELIKCKGFSVAPAELEAVLLEHPGVADCAVVGRPDHEAGEVPVAFVVPRRGSPVEPAELVSFAATRLAGYKRIRAVELVEAIPRSPAGKVLRHALRPTTGGERGDDATATA